MTGSAHTLTRRPPWAGFNLRPLLYRALATDALLTVVGIITALTLLFTAAGLLVDDRVITGAPAWLKPAKFAISISVYSFSLLLLLSLVQGHQRLVRLVARLTAVTLTIELAIIILQAARGTTSHFNEETTLDFALWMTMAVAVQPVWLMNLLTAVLLTCRRLPDAALAWSLRLGLLISLVGMAVGFPMAEMGSHSIGVADGGPGLPLVGWSTEGGDLRVGHFVGLHGLQVLPLIGWLLTLTGARLSRRRRLALVWTAGLGYLGVVLLVIWQALRGQPLTAPDGLTLTVAVGLALAVGVATATTLLVGGHRLSAMPPHCAPALSVTGER